MRFEARKGRLDRLTNTGTIWRTLDQFEVSAHNALAQTDDIEYEIPEARSRIVITISNLEPMRRPLEAALTARSLRWMKP